MILFSSSRAECEVKEVKSSFNELGVYQVEKCLSTKELMKAFKGLNESIKAIEVLNCSLGKLKKELFEEVNLTESLKLNLCQVSDISVDTFSSLSRLKILELSNNHLTTIIPGTFDNLTQLVKLDISGNQIQKIEPKTFAKNIKLEKLNLDDNKLIILEGKTFQNNSKLGQISLNRNKIMAIEPSFFNNLKKLSRIELERNVCVNKIINNFKEISEHLIVCENFYIHKSEIFNRTCNAVRRFEKSLKNVETHQSTEDNNKIVMEAHTPWMFLLVILALLSIFVNVVFVLKFVERRNVTEEYNAVPPREEVVEQIELQLREPENVQEREN